jgi:hypothetical protein
MAGRPDKPTPYTYTTPATSAAPAAGSRNGGPVAGAPKPFDPQDPTTWGGIGAGQTVTADGGKQGPNFNLDASRVDDAAAAKAWVASQSAVRPWESTGASWAESANNFKYGGTPGGAAAFNSQLAHEQQQLGQGYGGVRGTAATLGIDAGQLQAGVNARNPGQFLDQGSIQNNSVDRLGQQNAYNQLNAFAGAPMGPSAAQATLANATNANQANELAMARSGRGLGMNQANLHNAMVQNAGIQQNSANQAAILNAQEQQQYRANQLSALGALGGIANQMRTGDVQQGSYVTGSQQAGLNANDQTALGYGNQQLGAGNLALGAMNGNTSASLGMYGLQNDVNKSALGASENYESNLFDYYTGRPKPKPGTDYSPYLAAGGAIIGAAIGGPGGAVAGGAAGGAAGKAVS